MFFLVIIKKKKKKNLSITYELGINISRISVEKKFNIKIE